MNGVTEIIEFTQNYDLSALDIPDMPRFTDLLRDVVSGGTGLSLGGIIDGFFQVVFAEFIANGALIRQLIVIAILSALVCCLTEAFKQKAAGETGFYITYLMVVLLAVSSFYISSGILSSLVNTVDGIMLASLPMMVGLMAVSGNFAGAASFHPIVFFALQLIAWFISYMFIPLVFSSAALDFAGQIATDGNKLANLAKLLRKIASWSLKGILAAFAFLLTMQRFSAPIINNAALRTSRSLVGAVPVVGNAFTAAVDTVVHFGTAARSGVMVALVIFLCFVFAAPLIKLFALGFIYKAVAALLQPICDKRFIALIDGVGTHMAMLFNAAALIGVVCIYAVVVLLSF